MSLEFFIDIKFPVVSAYNINEYQEYFLRGGGMGSKEGQYVGLTTLPLSRVNCIDNWEPQPPENLRACPDLYRVCFTFTFTRKTAATARCIAVICKEDKFQCQPLFCLPTCL